MKKEDVWGLVGGTPHLRLRLPGDEGLRIWVKLEGMNPTGSIKDRSCVTLLRDALESGDLRPGKTLLDASSGNMASAIAYYGGLLGYPSLVVANSKLTQEKRAFIEYFGAELRLVGDFTIEGNRWCRELAEREPDRYCFLDQLHNWANPRAHEEGTGPEIVADFPDLALLVGSLGSGGSLLGTAQHVKATVPGVRVVAVQSASGTKLPGTGAFDDGDYVTPFIRKGFDEGIFDHVTKIAYADAVSVSAKLCERRLFAGLQTGGVVHAALAVAREQGIAGDIVVLSGDTGWKNLDTLMRVTPPGLGTRV